jgi:transposase InsO family protein
VATATHRQASEVLVSRTDWNRSPNKRFWSFGLRPASLLRSGQAEEVLRWAYLSDVGLDFSRPGKPTVNGLIEAFNPPKADLRAGD